MNLLRSYPFIKEFFCLYGEKIYPILNIKLIAVSQNFNQ